MRISSSQIFSDASTNLNRIQSNLLKTQNQIATGNRLSRPSDDAAATSGILRLQAGQARLDQYQKNTDYARNRLGLEDSSLNAVDNILQRIRELTLQADNASLITSDRQDIRTEVQQNLDSLLQIANSQDSSGEYIYGGSRGHTQPFIANSAGGFLYNGDNGQRLVQIGDGRRIAINDPGASVFRDIRMGNGTFSVAATAANSGTGVISNGSVVNPAAWVPDTYTITLTTGATTTYEVRNAALTLVSSGTYQSGAAISFNGIAVDIKGTPVNGDSFTVSSAQNRDLFTTVQNLVNTLDGSGAANTPTAITQQLNILLGDLDQSFNQILGARAKVGSRLNALEAENNMNQDLSLQLQSSLSNLKDTDLASASLNLNRQLVALQAAYQSFGQIQRLSLFNTL